MTKIELETGHLVYEKYGDGPLPLLAFHGFGQNRSMFKGWENEMGDKYTIYAFDLFYHGDSDRQPKKLTKDEWKEYLDAFLKQEKVDSYATLGYSLGGRFAIASTLAYPDRCKEINLIGPDGIFLTIWFKLATTPSIRWIFKYIMHHPDHLENLIHFNEKAKVINKYVADFVRKEMGNQENRKRVYTAWNHFKFLGYTRKELINAFQKYDFKRRLVVGSKDHIITPKGILPIIDKMGDFQVDVLPLKHHQLLNLKVAKWITHQD